MRQQVRVLPGAPILQQILRLLRKARGLSKIARMSIEREELSNGVVRLTINRPPVNALDLEAIAMLTSTFKQLAEAPPASGVLLTGAGKAFCGGVDVKAFASLDPAGRIDLARAITAMTASAIALPCPVITLVNGHALGGGLVLALCTDWRIAVDDPRIKLGLLEAKAGVPFPSGPMAILRYLLSGSLMRQLALSSADLSSTTMHDKGIIDELCAADELLQRGLGRLNHLSGQPGFAVVKRQTLAPLVDELTQLVRSGDEPFWEMLQ